MSNQVRTLADGVRFIALPNDRFKTASLTAAFYLPLAADTASAQAILPFLLRRGCAAYPDFTSLQKHLNRLYGAKIGGDVTRVGEAQCLLLSASGIDDRYALEGEPVTASCAALLRQMLFEPALENGLFRADDVEMERRCLIERIESEINNKRIYARHQCERVLCEGEAYAVAYTGTAADAAALTPEQITAAWKRMLEKARVMIIFQGSSGADAIADAFTRSFSAVRTPAPCPTAISVLSPGAAVRERTEMLPVNQCKLVMGFKLGIAEPGHAAMAARLMNAVFGGTPHSMLFRNVREKMSLCYYCASTYDRHKGIMLVDSGVELDKVEAAKAEVLRQLGLLQQGIITENDIESAKKSILNQFESVGDLQSSLASWYTSCGLQDLIPDPAQSAAALRETETDDVIAAAKSVTLDSVYLLQPQGEAVHE